MAENSGKSQGPRGQNAGPGPAGQGENRPQPREAPKMETEEWIFTVAKETGTLVKIERFDAAGGKREEVTLEQFGNDFMQRANNTLKTMYERQMAQAQQGQQGQQAGQNPADPYGMMRPYGYW